MKTLKNILATLFILAIIITPFILLPIAIINLWKSVGLLSVISLGDAILLGMFIYTDYVSKSE